MFPATGLIYYISERSIDQIYRSIYGPLDDARTTETRNERATSVAGKLGLDKLLALLTGATLSAEATVQRKKATSETFESRITTEDRAIRLLRDIFATESADISTIVDSENLLPLYTFSRPVNVSYRTVSSESNPLIEVSHSSPEIEFAGVTSPENWVSPSLLNNLLWDSSGGDSYVPVAGVLSPLSVNKDQNRLKMTVQYLVLLHPTPFDSTK